MRNLILGAALSALSLTTVGTAHAVPANLILNGSFEAFAGGVFTNWTNIGDQGVTPPQFAVPHPTDGVTPGQFGDVVPADPYSFSPDPAGKQGAYFVADVAAYSLTQTIALTVGTTYEVGFDLYATNSGAANPNFFSLTGSIDGINVTTATNSPPGQWVHYSKTFVAANSSATFAFTFLSGPTPAKDVIADLVYVGEPVTFIPEPMSLALLGAGLLGLGVTRLRTRKPM